MGHELELGTAKVDITPVIPVPLAGYAHRSGPFEGVDQPLYARIWFFQHRDETGRTTRALLIQADLIWWGPEQTPRLVAQLQEKWGMEQAGVILHATHSHGGPQTTSRFVPSLGMMAEEYVHFLESRLFEGVSTAYAGLGPVVVERGGGRCEIGIHRRKPVGGIVHMQPNPEGPQDPEVVVIRFASLEGKTKGVLLHYACHPTTSGDNRVTSDFPGAAMERVEEQMGGIASYLQGCCGDIRPALTRDNEFYRGDAEDVRRLGRLLGDEVLRVLDGRMERLAACPFLTLKGEVPLPFAALPSGEHLLACSNRDGITGEWGRLLLASPDRMRPFAALEFSVLRIAHGLSFLAMNAEMVVQYGLFVKARSGGAVLPLPYSNGMIGYVPTALQIAEGGYEACDSALFFGLPAPFEPSLEQRILASMTTVIKSVASKNPGQ